MCICNHALVCLCMRVCLGYQRKKDFPIDFASCQLLLITTKQRLYVACIASNLFPAVFIQSYTDWMSNDLSNLAVDQMTHIIYVMFLSSKTKLFSLLYRIFRGVLDIQILFWRYLQLSNWIVDKINLLSLIMQVIVVFLRRRRSDTTLIFFC